MPAGFGSSGAEASTLDGGCHVEGGGRRVVSGYLGPDEDVAGNGGPTGGGG